MAPRNATHAISEAGQLYNVDSPAFRQAFPLPSPTSYSYLVRQLGLVLCQTRQQVSRVQFAPIHLTEPAFATLAYHLADARSVRFLLIPISCNRLSELHGTFESALQGIARLADRSSFAARQPRKTRRRDLGALAYQHPLLAVIDAWRQSDVSALKSMIRRRLSSRFIQVSATPERPQLTIEEIGRGLDFYDPAWLKWGIGQRIQDQPDYALGRWAGDTYRDVILTNQPRLDDVDLVVRRPRSSEVRLRYTRILLPVNGPGSRKAVLSASFADDSIDLAAGFEQIAKRVVNDV